jgi:hypothetical protein
MSWQQCGRQRSCSWSDFLEIKLNLCFKLLCSRRRRRRRCRPRQHHCVILDLGLVAKYSINITAQKSLQWSSRIPFLRCLILHNSLHPSIPLTRCIHLLLQSLMLPKTGFKSSQNVLISFVIIQRAFCDFPKKFHLCRCNSRFVLFL